MQADVLTVTHENAARGAEFLDIVSPGWWHGINVETLDISCPCHCVLGQIYGDYTLGLFESGLILLNEISLRSTYRCGFNLEGYDVDSPDEHKVINALLIRAWRKLIAERQWRAFESVKTETAMPEADCVAA